MAGRTFLLLLIPLGLLLIRASRRWKFSPASMIALGVVSAALTWGLMYLAFVRYPALPDAADGFGSVSLFTREVPDQWLNRPLAERYGWLYGLVFYLICWGIAWALPGRPSDPQCADD